MATKISMGLNFALGAILTGVSLRVMDKTRKCTNPTFQKVIEGVLIMSVALLIASISYIICHITCKCEATESTAAKTLFALYFILVGIILIVLGVILQTKSGGQCAGAKNEIVLIWVMGILVLLTSGMFFFLENRKQLAGLGGEKKSSWLDD